MNTVHTELNNENDIMQLFGQQLSLIENQKLFYNEQ